MAMTVAAHGFLASLAYDMHFPPLPNICKLRLSCGTKGSTKTVKHSETGLRFVVLQLSILLVSRYHLADLALCLFACRPGKLYRWPHI